jgi:hypothetical protein
VALPHRRVVLDPLHVVPHAVAIDEVRAGFLADPEHAAVHVRGHPREHLLRWRAHSRRPLLAHEVVVAADAAARHDDGRGTQFEVGGHLPVRGRAAFRGIRSEHGAAHPDDRPLVDDEFVDPVAECQGDQTAVHSRTNAAYEGGEYPGAGSPGDVESRHRIAVFEGRVASAFGPAHHGEEPHALFTQPRSLLSGGEVEIRLGPLPRPGVFVAVESGSRQPVLPRQLE